MASLFVLSHVSAEGGSSGAASVHDSVVLQAAHQLTDLDDKSRSETSRVNLITLSVLRTGKETTQYKFLCTILNNIDVYEESVPRTKKIPHCAVKFEAGKENGNVYESLY